MKFCESGSSKLEQFLMYEMLGNSADDIDLGEQQKLSSKYSWKWKEIQIQLIKWTIDKKRNLRSDVFSA